MGGGSEPATPTVDPNLAQDVYTRWYERGSNAWEYNPEGENLPPEYLVYAQQGYQQGYQEYQMNQAMQQMTNIASTPIVIPPPVSSGPSYEEQLAEQQRQMGVQERDQLYSNYLTAAETAAAYVNDQIAQEQANAQLLGIDYTITDEQRQQRTSDYFASVWGAGDQARLETLINEYGAPEGFEDWLIVRGNAEGASPTTEASSTTVAVTRGEPGTRRIPPTILTDEDNILGPPATILGV